MNKPLGKKNAIIDLRTLQLKNYLATLPTIPNSWNWGSKISNWPMMMNDTIGDCTCAAAGHIVELDTTLNGTPDVPTDAQVLSMYESVSGYNPSNPSSDVGADLITCMKYLQNTGLSGQKLYAYASVSPTNMAHVKAATYLFSSLYIGVQLPITAQNQSGAGQTWTVAPDFATNADAQPNSWGGHCIPIVGFCSTHLDIVTWGELQYMSWNFLRKYCDEMYALLSQMWIGKATPGLLNLSQLDADLSLITG